MRPRALLVSLALASALTATVQPARAAGPLGLGAPPASSAQAAASAPGAAPPEQVASDSPRATVQRFLALCRAGELAEAAKYLDLSEVPKRSGPELAQRLGEVLERRAWGKVENLSPRSQGEPSDHLSAGFEQIGTIPGPNGPEPVRLFHRADRWVFSSATVKLIDTWYDRLPDRWLEGRLPAPMLRTGPLGLRWWQWIALPILFGLALGAGKILGFLTRVVLARLVERTRRKWDEALFIRVSAPLTVVWTIAAVELSLPLLSLVQPAEDFIDRVMKAILFAAVVWFAVRCVEVGSSRILALEGTRSNPAARSLVPLGARSLQVVLVVFAILAALSELGVAVGSLLAGLGIGGVALALAAQKTVENLFGSLSIGVDQPFRVGDYVTVDGLSGTVESIGLRSTRVRTLDRTLVTLPNGKLADMRIESFAGRDRIKLGCVLPLSPTTHPAQLREILTGIRKLLEDHPKVWPDVTVSLAKVSDASLDVEVLAWFQTTSSTEYLALREEMLLAMLEKIEAAGTTLSGAAAAAAALATAAAAAPAAKVAPVTAPPAAPPTT